MLKKLASAIIRKVAGIGIILGVILLIGYCASDRKDYPGKAEFEKPNSLITTNSKGTAHGNTEAAKQAAAEFASIIKPLQAAFFTGGSGKSFASGGDFVTYCRHNPDSAAFIVHVPELRNYKDAKTRDAIAMLAWTAANQAAKELTFTTESPAIIVGLRGFGSYGPIWSGKLGGEADTKTDEIDEVRRLYPFFILRDESK